MSHKDAKICRDLIRFWHRRNLSPESIVRQLRDGCPDCGMRHVRRELARMENRRAINAAIAAPPLTYDDLIRTYNEAVGVPA